METKRLCPTLSPHEGKGDCNNLVDRISDFPDEILDLILFFLNLKEAVGTSILSRRWRYLWNPTATPTFNLENCLGFGYLGSKRTRADIIRYIDQVDSAVIQNRGSIIEKLTVRFDLANSCYIEFKMKQRVGMLEVVRVLERYYQEKMKRTIYSSQDLNPMSFRKHLSHLLSKLAISP